MWFACEKEQIVPITLLSWATGANWSQSLFCKKGRERFAQGHSFLKSDEHKLLSISFKKSDISYSLVIRANRSQKTSDSLKKKHFIVCFGQFFPIFMSKSESLPSLFAQSLFFKEPWERYALVALEKRGILIPSLFTKEKLRAIRSRCSWQKSDCMEQFALDHKRITLLLTKNERFAQTTDEQIPNPADFASHGGQFWNEFFILFQLIFPEENNSVFVADARVASCPSGRRTYKNYSIVLCLFWDSILYFLYGDGNCYYFFILRRKLLF